MTNRGTAKRTRQRLKKREYKTVNGRTVTTWVDPDEEREKNKIPHSERHPNDISVGINLLKKKQEMEKEIVRENGSKEREREMNRRKRSK